ncbi:unnamed protein product [Effrenium voratum]|nr:unnamed protein product [Effrenium voratum]
MGDSLARDMSAWKRSVHLGGLPHRVTEADIRWVLSDAGEVDAVRIVRNKITQENQGFAFARFTSRASVKAALNLWRPNIRGKEVWISRVEDESSQDSWNSWPQPAAPHPATKRMEQKRQQRLRQKVRKRKDFDTSAKAAGLRTGKKKISRKKKLKEVKKKKKEPAIALMESGATSLEEAEAAKLAEESDAFETDFESLSSIPEAILESSSASPSPRERTVVLAWPKSASLEDTSRSMLSARTPRRTPVRRARVRGTVCLPTAFVFSPARRRGDVARRSGSPRESPDVQRLAQRALAYEEALEAERASYAAELAQKAREAEDCQAVLQAVAHDRSELAAMYRRASTELCRLRAELSQRTLEMLELRQDRSARNKCVVCLDAFAQMAFVPCGHLASCEACAGHLDACPVCRRRCESMLHIYMP